MRATTACRQCCATIAWYLSCADCGVPVCRRCDVVHRCERRMAFELMTGSTFTPSSFMETR